MKHKPHKHKEDNLFRFKTFSERIHDVDIRKTALYYIEHKNEDGPDECVTNFNECFEKWSVLNLTDEYTKFEKKIRNIVTLPQLVHQKDFIVDHLLLCLEEGTNLSLQPLLEFVVVLAKDLREEFYPYFPRFLDRLILLLNTKDPDQLEWTLVCLAFLFKALRSFIKKDISVVFNSLLVLLDESKPVHITNFAAECFSFVVRDIKDKSKFLGLVLKSCKTHPNGTTGCGRLLFEIMRGVNGDFHSCAEPFLTSLFEAIDDEKYDQELLLEVLTQTVTDILSMIAPKNMGVFWKISYKILDDFSKKLNHKCMESLLSLMGQAVECKSGKFLLDTSELIKIIIKTADLDLNENVEMILSKITALMLLSPNLNISQLDSSRLTRKILSTSFKNVFEDFVWNVVDYSQFEILIFPEFLKYLEINFDVKTLEILTKIILLKTPMCKNGINLENWRKYPIKLKKIEQIENFIIDDEKNDEKLILALMVYPHVIGNNSNEKVVKKMKEIIDEILEEIALEDEPLDGKEIEEYHLNKNSFFKLSILIETLIHLDLKEDDFFKKIIENLLPYSTHYKYIEALRIIDLIASSLTVKSDEFFNQILHEKISENLSSSFHEIRLLTCHIFSIFHPEHQGEDYYAVEKIIPSIHTYREMVQILQKIKNISDNKDSLKYLLGVLFMNFRLLWEPITHLMAEFSVEIPMTEFWEIIKNQLGIVEFGIKNENFYKSEPSEGFLIQDNDFLLEHFAQSWIIKDKIDFINYRVLLLKTLPNFGNLIEVKNREVVQLFLNFIESEYKKSDEDSGLTWNIKQEVEEVDSDEEDDEEIEKKKPNRFKKSKFPKGTTKTLISFISIFPKMQNPKQLYKESELYQIYLNLLSHKNSEIQKLSLDCIFAYKHKYLTPYKQNLYNIVDDKKFKDELTSFKIDKETSVVLEEHRPEFIPILMRILYSKMTTKVGTQKGGNQLRKSLVMRFIAGCHDDEVFIFAKMAFKLYTNFIQDDLIEMFNKTKDEINLENVLHPKKLQSSINFIEVIREQFGGLMTTKLLRYILNIILGIGGLSVTVLSKSDQISHGYQTMFKNLRNSCLVNLTKFFDHFDSYPWNDNEIDSVFQIFVWPLLEKLPSDSIHSPTSLLKLFIQWSSNPRYHILLSKSEGELTPIPFLMKLLLGPKTKPTVCSAIMEIVEKLITLQFEEDENCKEIKLENHELIVNDKLNRGSIILLPFISDILEKIKKNISKNKTRGISRRELLILSKTTELVVDSETCNTLITILVPILVKKASQSNGEEVMMQMVETLSNLLKKIDNPEKQIRFIAPMFEQITAIGPRKYLCQLIVTISKRSDSEEIKTLSDLVLNLNAWDRRWVEQPDYERRLEAMKKIGVLTKSGQIDINLGLMVVYHCFYFLKNDKDLAIRDSAGYHLKAIVPALAIKYQDDHKEREYLIGNIILNLVRRTIRDKNDAVRTEGIQLLGEMARECPQAHPVLRDLNALTNKVDREVDFFDNITHLQSHRHGRAFLRFCQVARTYESAPNPRTLTQFVLPLASLYLCSDKFGAKHTLVDAAIECVGAVCHLLPWFQYETILKFYLKKLRTSGDYQKQLVRIIMGILDSFHFDLTNAKVDVAKIIAQKKLELEEKNKLEEKEDEAEVDEELDTKEDDEELDSELDDCNENDEDEVEESPAKKIKIICAYDKQIVLTHNAAKRLVHTLSSGLLPSLNNAILKLTAHDSSHKLNRKKTGAEREEEDLMRVPIALAMVKLLQKLPEQMMKHNLPGIFMKICTFLKSPLKSVRMMSRDILRKIMLTLGPSYLQLLLDQLTSLLTRGFQVHVLVVTVHNILDALKNQLKPGDLDKSLQSLLSVCLEDIFGKASEEKEVDKIGVHTPEARSSNKTFLILNIIAFSITETCLLDLLIPFKNQLAKSQSKKLIIKIQECFQKIISGLVDNPNITTESLMIFIYGTASESIPDLLPGTPKPILTEAQKEKLKRARPDCFIVPEEPRCRSGAIRKVVRTNIQANAHVMVEFGLELLHVILKRGKVTELDYVPYLDPMIGILKDSLRSTHVRVSTHSLKCFSSIWNLKLEIPKLEETCTDVVGEMFLILHKYATTGLSNHDDNFHLVKNAFKAMVSLLRFAKYFTVTTDQLKALLLYVEQDLHSMDKQTFAFTLLKAIVSRKLIVPEMHDVMNKVGQLGIVSELSSVREESRVVFLNYLMDYPLGAKVERHLKFFVKQLNYEMMSGRESAILMLHGIVKKFPQNVLKKHSGFLFLSIGARLVNDETSECRILVADCLETLISRLEKSDRDELFELIVVLLEDKKQSHREMAAQLITRFVIVEKEEFTERLSKVIPILVAKLSFIDPNAPGHFVRVKIDEEESEDEEGGTSKHDDGYNSDSTLERKRVLKQRGRDHQLIQIQNSLLKIMEVCSSFLTNQEFVQHVDEISYQSQKLLAYEHVWVRLNAAKCLSHTIGTMDFLRVQGILKDGVVSPGDDEISREFIYSNPDEEIKSLALDLCAQLLPGDASSEMAEECCKLLLFIGNFLKEVPLEKSEDQSDDVIDVRTRKINLIWLIRRMRYVVHAEVAKAPHSIVLRTAVFNWIEGLVTLLKNEVVQKIAQSLLSPLVREMSEEDQNIDPQLKQLAIRVGTRVKRRIGEDEYNSLRSKIQTSLNMRRAERRKVVAQEKINDPQKAAKRKIRVQERKKESKKRRVDVIKGKAVPKKKRKRKAGEDDDIF